MAKDKGNGRLYRIGEAAAALKTADSPSHFNIPAYDLQGKIMQNILFSDMYPPHKNRAEHMLRTDVQPQYPHTSQALSGN